MRRREEPRDERPGESNTRQLIALLALAFVITLGVVVGTRMSSDAIAVLVGVIAGVAASIPTALLLMAVTRRRGPEVREPREEPRHAQPPVIVIAPGNVSPQQLPYPSSYAYPGPTAGSAYGQRRQFRVMGYDEEEDAPYSASAPIEGQAEAGPWYR